MADHQEPEPTPPSSPAPSISAATARARRIVYEPSLLPARRRRRVPRWAAITIVALLLLGGLYFVLGGGHHRRTVATAGTMVWASDAGTPGTPHLWRAKLNGTGARRLTQTAGAETQPSFSSDGSQVAYVSPASGSPQVFVVDADGLNAQQVTRNVGAKQMPRFAPGDGGLLAYLSGGAVSTVQISSGETSRLLPPPPDPSGAQQSETLINSPTVLINDFHWAPNTDAPSPALAAHEETADLQALVVLPSLSAAPRDTQSTQPGSPPLAAASAVSVGWSPSGSLLAVALLGAKGLPAGHALSAIALFDRDGSPAGQRPLAAVANATTGPQFPVFSPDGTQILFSLWQQADIARAHCLGLFMVPVNGSAPPRPLVQGDASAAQWAPDGQSVLFLRARAGGAHDLWRVGADGKGLVRLSDGTADISGFALSPQGKPSL